MSFLPINREEMEIRGWSELDFLFISGDAYVDHPSFGTAIITRILENQGYKVGVIAQPKVEDDECLKIMGTPRFGVLISSGVVDSMVNNYTSAKKHRSDDKYSPAGKGGIRPDRCLITYCNLVRKQFGEIPLVIGGVEASLRRFAHYDYWSNSVRRSILQDTNADILVYSMGEKAILEIADLLSKGVNVKNINSIKGTCVYLKEEQMPKLLSEFILLNKEYQFDFSKYTLNELVSIKFPQDDKYMLLPGFDEVKKDKLAYSLAFKAQYEEQVPNISKTLIQKHSNKYIIQNPPQPVLSTKKLDEIYDLNFERNYHPVYDKLGGVPSIQEVKFSINSHRGCFGGCHFCAITFHQGKVVRHRSLKSIENEGIKISNDPEFKGYIHDVGGPTANFYNPACEKQERGEYCKRRSCLFPNICPSLKIDHTDYLNVLKTVRSIPNVKKVFIRSGIRFDYVVNDKNDDFLYEISKHHISGQLKVAPEHTSNNVLNVMGKPKSEVYEEFKRKYEGINKKLDKKQFLVPYLISGHPGSTLEDAIEMAIEIKKNRVMPQQVQDFYPTPGTVSTAMYYTGLNPLTLESVYVPDKNEKQMQRALLQFSDPKNYNLTLKALIKAKREDLIGFGPLCLIRPIRIDKSKKNGKINNNKNLIKDGKNSGGSFNGKSNSRKRDVTRNKGRNKKTGR